jgi:hypothetical protein
MAEPYMTMAEIEAKYPNEWVLLDRITSRGLSHPPTGGYVVLHCADRAEFLRRFAEWNYDSLGKEVATWYTGKFPVEELLPADPESGVA